MRLLAGLYSIVLTSLLAAQDPARPDSVTLANGDTITGVVKTMAEGKVVFTSPLAGDITIPLANIRSIQTAGPVDVVLKNGDRVKRRITGFQDGQLLFADAGGGAQVTGVPLSNLDLMNPPPTPPVKWTGAINIGGGIATGNTERRNMGAAANAVRRTDQDRITATASWDYAEDKIGADWVLNQRRTFGGLQYDYFLSKKSYLLATMSALGDTKADLQLRFTAGVGYGYQWVERDDLKFSTEIGLNYFNENYRSNTPSNDYVAVRGAYNLFWQIAEGLRFLQTVQAFPSLEDKKDFYGQKDSRLQWSMTKNMFTQFQWVLDYDNTPAPGLERMDNRFLVSVGWTF